MTKFKDKLSKLFGKGSFDIDLTLANGNIVTVVTEAEEAKPGDVVKDSDGKPLDDGDYLLPDGSTIVIEGGSGVIKEIKPKAEEAPTEEPTLSEVMQSVNSLTQQFSQFKTEFAKQNKETQEGVEFVAKKFSALDKRVSEMGKGIKSKYEAPGAEDTSNKKKNESGYDADAVREAREKLKNKNN